MERGERRERARDRGREGERERVRERGGWGGVGWGLTLRDVASATLPPAAVAAAAQRQT
jgi:hypothetical protein